MPNTMRKLIYIVFCHILALSIWSCSEDIMDTINQDVNDPTDMVTKLSITDAMTSDGHSHTGSDS